MTKESSQSLVLPAVTVCNFNFNSRSRIKKYFPVLEQFYDDLNRDPGRIATHLANTTVVDALATTSLVEFYLKTAQPFEEMFVECQDSNFFMFNCSDYIVPIMTDRGVCYAFNAGIGG